jgi:hypothetical protein
MEAVILALVILVLAAYVALPLYRHGAPESPGGDRAAD